MNNDWLTLMLYLKTDQLCKMKMVRNSYNTPEYALKLLIFDKVHKIEHFSRQCIFDQIIVYSEVLEPWKGVPPTTSNTKVCLLAFLEKCKATVA